MPSFSVDDLDIDVDEFLTECNKREIKEVREWLVRYGASSISENDELSENLLKISQKVIQLTV